MHPADCPPWEYDQHPRRALVQQRVKAFLVSLRRGELNSRALAADTRPLHASLFEGLTPPGCDYFRGNYRGERFRCLEYCRVFINGDPSVGASPDVVPAHMRAFAQHVLHGAAIIDAGLDARGFTEEQKLLALVAFASSVFVAFLTIHPYVNGNGHMARAIVWCLLGRYGYWPKDWPVDPRPAEPYTVLITKYRNGDPVPLESFFLRMLTS
jgi:fido (protein-threonine AMPylation protein)